MPLISSWESQSNPRLPPLGRLDTYARLFASATPLGAQSDEQPELSEAESQTMGELKSELRQLRRGALQLSTTPRMTSDDPIGQSISSGPYYFPDGDLVTIVCARLPQPMLDKIPYTNLDDPDYIELLTYSELDSLFELQGHIRAANPESTVYRRLASQLLPDDYHSHLAVLGGVDWNALTMTTLERLEFPVRQVADWDTAGGQYFEVAENGSTKQYRPVLGRAGDRSVLHEDVALFVRAVSPYNRERTVTIATGMYGRGTYGAVRALTDFNFRDRNAAYLDSRFGGCEVYCILTRVPVIHGATLTPDWSIGDQTLFEWSR